LVVLPTFICDDLPTVVVGEEPGAGERSTEEAVVAMVICGVEKAEFVGRVDVWFGRRE
jgi:hypothetical protein